jgi:phosphoglycolate phosphatase-like HAD superfamily hydrolase
VTNNSWANTEIILRKFNLSFDRVLTRESGLWKPSGLPIKSIIDYFQLKSQECAVVGDSLFDVQAAREAGVNHIFILTEEAGRFSGYPVKVFPSIPALQDFVRREYFQPS